MRGTTLCALLVLSVGCTRPNVGAGGSPPDPSGGGDQGGTTPVPPGGSSSGGSGGIGGGGNTGGGGGGGGGIPAPCYSESLDLAASIDDLQTAFQPGWNGNWLATALAVLDRRTPGG